MHRKRRRLIEKVIYAGKIATLLIDKAGFYLPVYMYVMYFFKEEYTVVKKYPKQQVILRDNSKFGMM